MPENAIKPSEVSEVLLRQLQGIDTSLKFDEVGTVLQVSDGVARIYGLRNAEANELLQFENGIMGTVMNLEEDNVGAVLLGPTDQIKEGMIVKRTRRIASINVGEGMLGRVIDLWVYRWTDAAKSAANVLKCRWNARLRELFSVSR